MIKLVDWVSQDGADFYHEKFGLIASYPDMVRDDHDMDGAVSARRQFAADYPEYASVDEQW
jgi:hypothetical protein